MSKQILPTLYGAIWMSEPFLQPFPGTDLFIPAVCHWVVMSPAFGSCRRPTNMSPVGGIFTIASVIIPARLAECRHRDRYLEWYWTLSLSKALPPSGSPRGSYLRRTLGLWSILPSGLWNVILAISVTPVECYRNGTDCIIESLIKHTSLRKWVENVPVEPPAFPYNYITPRQHTCWWPSSKPRRHVLQCVTTSSYFITAHHHK